MGCESVICVVSLLEYTPLGALPIENSGDLYRCDVMFHFALTVHADKSEQESKKSFLTTHKFSK